mmetsp:Transcript_17452/g.35109  ORF Transcript_17452/g.35109 Transcript_17452/m.35109 type:complete len:211 (-) Transcript_17452:330-962(-)
MTGGFTETEVPPDWLVSWRLSGFQFDQSHPDFLSRNAIEVSALNGDIEAFRYIQKEIPGLYTYLSRHKESVLYIAVQKDHVGFANYVLNNGGEHLLNAAQEHGKTPLWAAIFRPNSVTMVKLLMFHGASLTAPSFSPIAELRYATQVQDFLLPLRSWLIKMQSRTNQEKPLLLCHEMNVVERSWLTDQVKKKKSRLNGQDGIEHWWSQSF